MKIVKAKKERREDSPSPELKHRHGIYRIAGSGCFDRTGEGVGYRDKNCRYYSFLDE